MKVYGQPLPLESEMYMFTERFVHKLQCIQIMEYRSAIKKNGLLVHAPVWMSLKIVMLSERLDF